MGIHSADLCELVARAPSIDNVSTIARRRASTERLMYRCLATSRLRKLPQPALPETTTYVIDNLSSGHRIYFAAACCNLGGVESTCQGRQLGRIGDIFIHNLSNRVLLHLIGVGEYDDFAHQADCQ